VGAMGAGGTLEIDLRNPSFTLVHEMDIPFATQRAMRFLERRIRSDQETSGLDYRS
jgi:hypothetical protein